MKRVIAWFKNIRPAKILTAFVASIFLMLTQACNNPGIAAQPPQPGSQPPNAERYDPTKSSDLNSPKGGMNNFNDVDSRAEGDQSAAEARSKALRDNAQRNINQKGIDSVDQYKENFRQGTPLGQRVKNLGEDIGGSAQELGEGVAKGAKRAIENIKGNAQNAAEDAGKNAQRAGEDVKTNVQRAGEDAADAVKGTFR